MTRRALTVFVVLGALVMFAAPSAQANAVTDAATCRQSPDPQTPDGSTGFTVHPPDDLPPADADPFAPGSPYTVYDVYGYGGLQWPVYDQGCVGNAMAAPLTNLANLLSRGTVFFVGVDHELSAQMRQPTYLSAFDPLVATTAANVHDGPWTALLPVTLLLAALTIIFAARRGLIAGVLSTAVGMVGIFFLAILFMSQPLTVVHWSDDTLVEVTSTIDASFGDNQSQIGQIHHELLYSTWAVGMFGDADTPTAREYGPKLFAATAYTWREAKQIRDDPSSAQGIKDEKQQRFADLADEISHKDPIAYEHLKGAHPESRLLSAVVDHFAVLGSVLFAVIAGIATVIAFFTFRVFVLLWPVTAILAVIPHYRTMVLHLWERLTGAALAAVGLTVIGRFVTLFDGAILTAQGIPPWLDVVLILGVFWSAWKLGRAHHGQGTGHLRVVKQALSAFLAYKAVETATEHGVDAAEKAREARVTDTGSGAGAPSGEPRAHTRVRETASFVAPEPSGLPAGRGLPSGQPVPDSGLGGLGAGRRPAPSRVTTRADRADRARVVDMEQGRDGVYRVSAGSG